MTRKVVLYKWLQIKVQGVKLSKLMTAQNTTFKELNEHCSKIFDGVENMFCSCLMGCVMIQKSAHIKVDGDHLTRKVRSRPARQA